MFAPQVTAEHYRWHLEFWRRAEEFGFEGIFFSEHHFGLGFSPSPNLLIARTAAVTRTLRLGVMGVVLPYYEPWRVVEEIGMLDQLTGGRIEIGTASGIPQEMAQVGLSVEEANARAAEAIEILDAALRQPVISHHGKYWNFDNLRIEPRPVQQSASAEMGDGRQHRIRTQGGAARRQDLHRLSPDRPHPRNFRRLSRRGGARRPSGRAGPARHPPQHQCRRRRQTRPGRRRAIRCALYREALTHDPRFTESPLPDAPGPTHTFSVGDDEFIAGTGMDVAEQIIAQCRRVGCGHFLCNFGRMPTLDQRMAAFELYARDVIPVLRRAAV